MIGMGNLRGFEEKGKGGFPEVFLLPRLREERGILTI